MLHVIWLDERPQARLKVKSHSSLSGPHGRFLQASRSIASPHPPPTGWDASPLQGLPVQYIGGSHFYARMKKDNVE